MEITAAEIGELLNADIIGDKEVKITGFSPIEKAENGSLSFLSNTKYIPYLYTTKASAVLVARDFVPEKPSHPTLIMVDDVYTSLSKLLEQFNNALESKSGIEQPSFMAPSVVHGEELYLGAFAYLGQNARLGKGVKIYPQVYVGSNVKIGDHTILFPGVKIYDNCVIGSNCILHAGVVVGSDGFGFAPQDDGSYRKMPQTGNVIIEDDVEIGANTTIDRATISSTIIRKGVKLDNLIMVAHNVEIGTNTVIAAQTGISGSTKIEGQCVIAGQVGIVGHIKIAKGSQIGAKSGVGKSISEPEKKWHGIPVAHYKDTLRSQVIIRNLPSLQQKIQELEQMIQELKATLHQ